MPMDLEPINKESKRFLNPLRFVVMYFFIPEYEVGQFAIEPKSKIDIVIGKNI